MSDKEPLKITLDDLEPETVSAASTSAKTTPEPPAPAVESPAPAVEAPAMPERPAGKLREGVEGVGHKVADAVKESTTRVTHKIADTTAEAASRSAEAVRDKVGETIQAQAKATADAVEARLREVDWKAEAQKGAEGSLRWLSKRLEELAERMKKE